MSRPDERKWNQLRRLKSDTGSLERAHGSAEFSQGNTCALSAINGPLESYARDELADQASVDVKYTPRAGSNFGPESDCTRIEQFLTGTLREVILTKSHPRTTIVCTVQEVDNDGSMLSTCVNSLCLALLEASIPMKSLVLAASAGLKGDGELILDPILEEEQSCVALFTFCFSPQTSSVIASHCNGVFTHDHFVAALELCHEACKALEAFIRTSLTPTKS